MDEASSARSTRQFLAGRLLLRVRVQHVAATLSALALTLALTSTARAQTAPPPPQPPSVTLRGLDARGQAFDLQSLRGNVVALTFVSRYTQDEAARVNAALGRHSDLKVVSIVDFVGIPRFVHDYARRKVAESDGRIQHLCDVDGALGRQFATAPRDSVAILIIDRDGTLRGRFDATTLAAAERLVDDVRAQAKR